jgi:hypothetical protein
MWCCRQKFALCSHHGLHLADRDSVLIGKVGRVLINSGLGRTSKGMMELTFAVPGHGLSAQV